MISLAESIKSLCPDSEFILEDEDYTLIKWIKAPDNTPTLDQLLTESQRLENLRNSQIYMKERFRAYPSIQEQLDTLYHGGYDAWKASIKAVKDKYPKPETE